MDDRELLELAAKAAGIEGKYEEVYEMGEQFYSGFRMGAWKFWNPLTDDGDALRLAVTLTLLNMGARFQVSIGAMRDGRGGASAGFFSRDNPDQSAAGADLGAATRRAIVLAAAEIGKTMK